MKKLYKYGVAIISDNRLLLCRPFAFRDLIIPGGIREGEENHITNLIRETSEELGDQAKLVLSSLEYLGNFEDVAAGRSDAIVEIELYKAKIDGTLKASSEIAELVWFDPRTMHAQLSPIVKNKILPFLITRGLLKNDHRATG